MYISGANTESLGYIVELSMCNVRCNGSLFHLPKTFPEVGRWPSHSMFDGSLGRHFESFVRKCL